MQPGVWMHDRGRVHGLCESLLVPVELVLVQRPGGVLLELLDQQVQRTVVELRSVQRLVELHLSEGVFLEDDL